MGRFSRRARRRKGHNYLPMVMRHAEEMQMDPGSIHHIETQHDDNCRFWSGGFCDCSPTIVSGPAVDKKYSE